MLAHGPFIERWKLDVEPLNVGPILERLEHFKQCCGRKGDEPQSHEEHKGSKESIFVFFVTLWLSGYSFI